MGEVWGKLWQPNASATDCQTDWPDKPLTINTSRGAVKVQTLRALQSASSATATSAVLTDCEALCFRTSGVYATWIATGVGTNIGSTPTPKLNKLTAQLASTRGGWTAAHRPRSGSVAICTDGQLIQKSTQSNLLQGVGRHRKHLGNSARLGLPGPNLSLPPRCSHNGRPH